MRKHRGAPRSGERLGRRDGGDEVLGSSPTLCAGVVDGDAAESVQLRAAEHLARHHGISSTGARRRRWSQTGDEGRVVVNLVTIDNGRAPRELLDAGAITTAERKRVSVESARRPARGGRQTDFLATEADIPRSSAVKRAGTGKTFVLGFDPMR